MLFLPLKHWVGKSCRWSWMKVKTFLRKKIFGAKDDAERLDRASWRIRLLCQQLDRSQLSSRKANPPSKIFQHNTAQRYRPCEIIKQNQIERASQHDLPAESLDANRTAFCLRHRYVINTLSSDHQSLPMRWQVSAPCASDALQAIGF